MKKAWWKEAVVYQIYPRSFMDSNGDGIGDIPGIISKLDYLKDLGVDVVWLSPVYKSPNKDNGYDISDYCGIMDEFGTFADWEELVRQMHARGLKLVMDLVVNHSSDQHKWFVEARKSKDNPYRDYYIWRDPKPDGSLPNNWTSHFSGPAWTFDETTGQYYLHLFCKEQPDLNWENAAMRHDIYDMLRFWLDRGVDGFRMDVLQGYAKAPGLPDGAPVPGGPIGQEYFANQPRIHDYVQEMTREVFSKYDIMTVGETGGVKLEDARLYTGEDRGEVNMVFQFEHVDLGDEHSPKWFSPERVDIPALKKILSKWQTGLDGCGWNSLYFSNHDQPRQVSRFGDDGRYRVESAKMLATLLHTQQGTPYIYQGEELGMTNMAFPDISCYQDVQILNAWQEFVVEGGADPARMMRGIHLRGRDNARTPMQWSDQANAGFTSGKPWLGVNPNYKTINAEAEAKDPDSVLSYYKLLIAKRKKTPVVVYGSFREYEPENPYLYLYEREYEGQRLFVVLNMTGEERPLTLPEGVSAAGAECYIANYPDPALDRYTLRPYEAMAYLLQ